MIYTRIWKENHALLIAKVDGLIVSQVFEEFDDLPPDSFFGDILIVCLLCGLEDIQRSHDGKFMILQDDKTCPPISYFVVDKKRYDIHSRASRQ